MELIAKLRAALDEDERAALYSTQDNGTGQSRQFGPKTKDDPSIGKPCPACQEPFRIGDFTTIIELGPGADPEEQRKAFDGYAYTAVAIEVHWACATGDTTATGW